MLRRGVAAMVMAAALLAGTPAVAPASVTSSQITSWVSSQPGTPANNPYLISLDNAPTTLTVSGHAPTADLDDPVDIVCFYGSPPHFIRLATVLVQPDRTFHTGAKPLRPIAGHACRLRAVPAGSETTIGESDSFAGPQVAVSEAALPASAIANGRNVNKAYNVYVNDVTFTGAAAWSAAGTPAPIGQYGCGGPDLAPIDPAFDIGNFALDCTGSLLADDLGAWGGRSEVQIDGRNAYDSASGQALFGRIGGMNNGSEDLSAFPTLTASVAWDPTSGLISSRSQEGWVACSGPDMYKPTSINACPSFDSTGVSLARTVTTSDGGRVVTLSDTWSSTDGQAHTLDLLYDDFIGLSGQAPGERGYEFPGQSTFSQYGAGDAVPGPATVPGSILVRTNVAAADGDPAEAFGAITFGSAPAGYRFASNNELEEHNVLTVPAGGSASLTYVYSTAYSLADVRSLALLAQGRFQAPAVPITSPGNGPAVSTPVVNVPAPPSPVAMCRVPPIKGMKLSAAERALRRADCRVAKIKRVQSKKVVRGRVMSSSPRAGRELRAGSKVELFVSRGP